jgi:hypothetical protein
MESESRSSARRRTGPFGPAREILPESQRLECLSPADSLLVALERLCEAGFNQAPVRDASECISVLRFFQVVQQLLEQKWFRDRLHNMPVRNHVDLSPRYIGMDDWVDVGFDWQSDDLALVGSPRDVQGMLTATDILGRLTDYAQAVVHLEAIEFDTRAHFDLLLPLPESGALVLQALAVEGKEPPRQLRTYDHLNFGHYSLIFGREATFERLQPACIWDRAQLARRVQRVGELRNTLLHFRGCASAREVDELESFAKRAALALARAEALVESPTGSADVQRVG